MVKHLGMSVLPLQVVGETSRYVCFTITGGRIFFIANSLYFNIYNL